MCHFLFGRSNYDSATFKGNQLCLDPFFVLADSVEVISNVHLNATTQEISSNPLLYENAQDHIVLFQDPDKAHKTLVCHKKKFTISVGTPAAQNGHMSHGDSLGECKAAANPASTDPATGSDKSNKNGNGKCNGKGNIKKNQECSA